MAPPPCCAAVAPARRRRAVAAPSPTRRDSAPLATRRATRSGRSGRAASAASASMRAAGDPAGASPSASTIGLRDRPDPLDLDPHDVARAAGRPAGSRKTPTPDGVPVIDEVAGLEGDAGRDEGDELGDGEDHVGGAAVLDLDLAARRRARPPACGSPARARSSGVAQLVGGHEAGPERAGTCRSPWPAATGRRRARPRGGPACCPAGRGPRCRWRSM